MCGRTWSDKCCDSFVKSRLKSWWCGFSLYSSAEGDQNCRRAASSDFAMLPVRLKENFPIKFADAIVQFDDYPANFKGYSYSVCNRRGDISSQAYVYLNITTYKNHPVFTSRFYVFVVKN